MKQRQPSFWQWSPQRAGAALLEVIVAVGIVTLVMTTIVSLVSVSLKSASLAQSKTLGTKYAQEGLESLRQMRNLLGWDGYVSTLTAKGLVSHLCLPTVPTTVAQLAAIPNASCTSNQFVDPKNLYQRQADVTITSANGQTNVAINVVVTWNDAGVTKQANTGEQLSQYTTADVPINVQYSPLPYGYTNTAGGYWKLDDAAGSTALDSSGNGTHGTWAGTVSNQWTTGVVNGAGNFSGTDYVNLPSIAPSTFNFTGDVTVMAWVKTSTDGKLIFMTQNNNPLIYLEVGATTNGGTANKLVAYFRTDAGTIGVFSGATTITNGAWHQVAAVRSTSAKTVTLYVDGVADGSGAFTDVGPITSSGASGVHKIGGAGANLFVGQIDEARIYGTAWTPAQILADYNSYSSSAIFNPIGYWKFDEGSGSTVADSSGAGNTGTWGGTLGSQWGAGISNGAGTFNGANTFVSVNSTTGNSADITVGMWIKPTNFAAAQVPINKGSQFSFQIDTSGNVAWADSSNYSYANFGATNIGLQAGVWQYLVFTKTNGVVTIYLNGVSKSVKSFGGAISNTANTLLFGCYPNVSSCSSQYFNGSMDEVKIYGYARTGAQVAADYSAYVANTYWAYRLSVPITNSSGATQTNYQSLVTLNTAALISAGKMLAGCTDLRITASDGTTKLPYWIEPNTCNTAATKIWVQVDSIPTTGTNLYAYYGNVLAPAAGYTVANVFQYDKTGVVGAWAMDEASWTGAAGEVKDASGNNNNGTIHGGTTQVAGKFGTAANLNGAASYISIPNSATIALNGDMSFSMWVNPSATQVAYATLFSKHGSGEFTMEQLNLNTNKYYFGWDTGGGAFTCVSVSAVTLTPSTYQHLVVSKLSNVVTFYLNGTAVGSCTGSSGTVATNSLNFDLGAWSASSTRNWAGQLDDVRVFNRALTAADATAIYGAGVSEAYATTNYAGHILGRLFSNSVVVGTLGTETTGSWKGL